MNQLLKFIILLSVTFSLFSCSDEFVDEKLNLQVTETSEIIISPGWEAADYQFKCDGIADADFRVISKPDWLLLENNSGKFNESIATIHASAIEQAQFSKMGFYLDQMIITSGGKNYLIPMHYLSEGNPLVEVNRQFQITGYYEQLLVGNIGEGLLFWDIISIPSWLTVRIDEVNPIALMLRPGQTATIPVVLDLLESEKDDYTGKIILKTNDKKNPLVEIAVNVNLGNPNIMIVYDEIDFGVETSKTYKVYNQGTGILNWYFEGLPEWLSVAPASGKNMPWYSKDVVFTCDRSKLQSGLNSAIIKLKSNDPDTPSANIVVKYLNP